MHAYQPATVTEDEFLALPVTMDKVELLDGEVIMAPAPSGLHQEVLLAIAAGLRAWARSQASPVHVGIAPRDIRFAPNRILQPDAFVVLDRVDLRAKGPLDRVPEVVIEVHSPSDRVYDRVTKRMVYADAGVSEYWLVHLAGFAERWSGPRLERHEPVLTEVTSPLLPGFSLDLRAIFPRD